MCQPQLGQPGCSSCRHCSVSALWRATASPVPALHPQKGPLSFSGPVVPARSVHLLMGRWRGFGAQLPLVAFALLLAVFGLVQGLSHLQRPGGRAGQLLRAQTGHCSRFRLRQGASAVAGVAVWTVARAAVAREIAAVAASPWAGPVVGRVVVAAGSLGSAGCAAVAWQIAPSVVNDRPGGLSDRSGRAVWCHLRRIWKPLCKRGAYMFSLGHPRGTGRCALSPNGAFFYAITQ